MGNTQNIAMSINLERRNFFYFSDETIFGSVDLNIMEKKLEADEIYISLTDEIGKSNKK